MRSPEKNDDETIINVIKVIAKHWPPQRILKEPFLIFHDTGAVTIHDIIKQQNLTPACQIQHPDIVLLKHQNKISCIIEIDGSIHYTRPGKRQTHKRNYNYELFSIPYCIIDDDSPDEITKLCNFLTNKQLY